ncbi:hypothetical protein MLD38_002344 [Melastoma candidum]|uniref:Uncharacterized protein n=1 Tax=Melastoma candidum TaxID=119954 RepID=A0ACB9S7L4_9MYRT|nr:hypothetical protein MLD38_002344 [Melastoma candidum]
MDYRRETNPHFTQPPETTRPPHGHPPPPIQSPLPTATPPSQLPQQEPHPLQTAHPQVPPLSRSQRRQTSFPQREPEDHYPIHNHSQRPPAADPALEPDQPERSRRNRRRQGQLQLVEPPPRTQRAPPPPSAPRAPPPQRKQTIDVPFEQPTEPVGIDRERPSQNLRHFPQQKTRFPTWFIAIFCAIFWLIIIVGGLIVLIVYLVFRPHMPRFDIPAASLNAAYLDLGTYLNADVTLLVNFTNPNKKVSVDFSSVILDFYYGSNPIATQYIEPFSVASRESRFAHAHMVSSEVRLLLADSQRLSTQLASNGLVMFEVRGLFRTRSNLGSFLRYSYWLYGHCTIALTGPPQGVLRASKCTTKR